MSRALQRAIVYELFAVVLAIVVAAAAVAESVTAGYLTGPWLFFAVPLCIALVGFLQALFTSPDGPAEPDRHGPDGDDPDVGDDPGEADGGSDAHSGAREAHTFPPY